MSRIVAASRLVVVCLVLAFILLPAHQLEAAVKTPQASSVVRISQVYGGGGSSSSPYGCDFIELFNSSAEPVELTGWSVQYHNGSAWVPIKPGVIRIPAFSYYLVAKQPCADGNRPPVPTPDFATTGSIALGTINGRAALARNEAIITGPTDPDVADLVGYGTASEFEGTGAAPALSNTTSAQRKNGGCLDQDDNKTDFETLPALPRNTASAQHVCSDVAPSVSSVSPADGSANVALSASFTITFSEPVTVVDDWFRIECGLRGDIAPDAAVVSGGPATYMIDPNEDLYGDDTCSLTVFADKVTDQDAMDPPDGPVSDYTAGFATAPGACGAPAYPVRELQGSGASSPVAGEVRTVEAVVSGDFQGPDRLGGFFVEEEATDRDTDETTSEGLFVSDGSAALLDVAAGQRVRLTGRVAETEGRTALTDLTRAVDCGTGELPAPMPAVLPAPSSGWWEQVEGMRVAFDEPLSVAGSDALGPAGQLRLVAGSRPLAYTQLNEPDAPGYSAFRDDLDARTVVLDDGSDKAYPDPIVYPAPGLSAQNSARIGDQVAAGLTGVVDGRGTGYRIQPTAAPAFVAVKPRPPVPPNAGNVRAVFLSLDDYFTPDEGVFGPRGADNEAELTRQRDKLVAALVETNPAIIAVSGRENNGFGVGSALADLVNGLNAVTEPGAYAAVGSGAGAWGGGETTVGLIYRAGRVTPVGNPAILDTGVFAQTAAEPVHAAPMAQTFEEATWGERFTVVANQWHDRGACPAEGADADLGDGQGCWSAARATAADELAPWLASDPTGSGDPDVLILGELNAFRQEDPVLSLTAGGYTNLIAQFAGDQMTTALWEGQAGYADHALASGTLAQQVMDAQGWPINADEPRALDYQMENKSPEQLDLLYAPDAFRSSDRDPVLVDMLLMPDQSDLANEYGLAWHTGQGEWRLGSAWGGEDDGVTRDAASWNDGEGELIVSVSGPAQQYACLHAWLDYSDGNAQAGTVDAPNGRWDDNEKVIDGAPLQPGPDQTITFPLPSGVMNGSAVYNLRARLVPASDPSVADCADQTAGGAGLASTGRADGGEVEDWAFSSGPLAVHIAFFEAGISGEVTSITWETVDEIDAVGFNLYGGPTQDGPWQRINDKLIPAKLPGSAQGATYAFEHRGPRRAAWYRLEALEASGVRSSFGPIPAVETGPNAVAVSRVAAQSAGDPRAALVLSCLAAAIVLWASRRRLNR